MVEDDQWHAAVDVELRQLRRERLVGEAPDDGDRGVADEETDVVGVERGDDRIGGAGLREVDLELDDLGAGGAQLGGLRREGVAVAIDEHEVEARGGRERRRTLRRCPSRRR